MTLRHSLASLGRCMCRFIIICSLCLTSLTCESILASDTHAPWVSCFADPPSDAWRGPKTVRTPLVASSDGRLRAYAQIEAHAGGQVGCHNTVRLFVSTQRSAGFRQVFMQKASPEGGTANSLGPVGWSPDGRWLLVEFAVGSYASDAGGIDVLLYDRREDKVVFPDVNRMIKATVKQDCSIRIGNQMGFDALSQVHLRLADYYQEGEDQPDTHCFDGEEDWALNLEKSTMERTRSKR
jgi:hypothetical protein